jgi:hypothetical protein
MDRSQADPRPWAEISFDVDCLTVWYWVPSFVSPVWERILAAFPAQGAGAAGFDIGGFACLGWYR